MEIITYSLGLLCTIFLAWLFQSVWSLVWGGVVTSSLKTIASHVYLHGIKNRFAWDGEALSHVRGFGRWIMLGSALTFLSNEGARLIIGAVLDMRQLALFTLASTMSLMLWQAMQQLAVRVYFPAYSSTFRSNPENLSSVLFKARLTIILPNWAVAVFFLFFGTQLMDTLYDERYHGSGYMLELLATGLLFRCVWGSNARVLLAMGKAATETVLTATQILFQIGGIYIGYYYWGAHGIVMGVAAASWAMYPVNAYVMARVGLWQPRIDLTFIAASVLVVIFAWPDMFA